MTKSDDQHLRQNLAYLLSGGGAHAKFDDVIKDLPQNLRGKKPANFPHSPWMILEHLRIAQWDILEFCRDSMHVSPEWPSGYWPKHASPPNSVSWEVSLKSFQHDTEEMAKLVIDPNIDITAPIPHGSGQTILREALLVADHNSYHLGQVILLRRLLGSWTET